MALTGKQKRFLRGLGHPLPAIVTVGKEGLTDKLAEALNIALGDHELVKVRIGGTAEVERKQAAADLAQKTDSQIAQILGNTILLYRTHPEKPKLKLPAAGG